ncbi:glycogen debranching protein GlgX [Micrococcus terreus]|uniref:glycogen debranching protein GlgX n=1 Tax=Micrococcus terreus TaxID=574650 RepID=UPI003018C8B1
MAWTSTVAQPTGTVAETVVRGHGHRSRPFPLGVHAGVPGVRVASGGPSADGFSAPADEAVNVAVYAPGCERLDVVFTGPDFPLDRAPRAEDLIRVPLPDVTAHVHHGTVAGLGEGCLYAFVRRGGSAEGAESGEDAAAEPPVRPILDPYSRAVTERDGQYWSVRVPAHFDWGGVERPHTPLRDTVVYEAHVIGQTRLHPEIPEELRGTYAGLAHPVMIRHLQDLGVTAVELLPIHHHADEQHLQRLGLENYWGYNTVGFFSPHPGYATAAAQAAGPKAVQDEVKGMIRLLHQAGIEVILDVVYNHTAEEGPGGPSFCWRELGEQHYYRHDAQGRYVDTTGCGNALDFGNSSVVQMTLDSLRHWVTDYQVDGFRFDLAVTLCRDSSHHFTPHHPFLVAAHADPVLAGVKLISEPWDVSVGGWQTGHFPAGWSDWNDRYRDVVRDFWVADRAALERGRTGGSTARLADCLSGSAALFGASGRSALASVNLVTAHDGFTLRDLVSYNEKHNQANGEDNRDGNSHNRSFNHGVEGPTEDPAVRAARGQTARNVMATLMLSLGVPMITAGDELGRTQGGNNNAYCQNNEISWTDWELNPEQERMLETTRALIRIRKEFLAEQPYEYPARERGFLHWFNALGQPMSQHDWADPGQRLLQMLIGAPGGRFCGLVVFHGGLEDVQFRLPRAEHLLEGITARGGTLRSFILQMSTARGSEARIGARMAPGESDLIEGSSISVYTV